MPATASPGLKLGLLEASTIPTAPPVMTAPTSCGFRVGPGVVQHSAHIGVERQKRVPHQNLPGPGRRTRRLDDAEVRGRDLAGRAMVEQNLKVAGQGASPDEPAHIGRRGRNPNHSAGERQRRFDDCQSSPRGPDAGRASGRDRKFNR